MVVPLIFWALNKMTKDYANRVTSKRKSKKKSTRVYSWLFTVGFFVGFTMFLVYLGQHKSTTITNVSTPTKQRSHNLPPKKEKTPTFDFYTIAPQKHALRIQAEYELEIPSIKNFATADNLKARLALLNLTASILPTQKNGKKRYLLTIGPYTSKDKAIADRTYLRKYKINTELKKIN